MGTDTGDLEDEDAIVVEKIVDLPEECLIPANSDVLGTVAVNSPDKIWGMYSPRPSRD